MPVLTPICFPSVNASQVSAADITLPDIVVHDQEEGDRWEEEDPLFFGGAIESGANPLDVNYDAAAPEDPELRRDTTDGIEEPEIRRDSDGSALNIQPPDVEMDPYLAGPDLPDFEDIQLAEPPKARPSEALSSVPPTPLREGDSMPEGMEFDTPVVEVKRPRLANKRKRQHQTLDKSTEIPKDVVRAWIMNADAVSDIIREPQRLPRNRGESVKGEVVRSKALDAVMAQPLAGGLGPRLHRFMLELASPDRRPPPVRAVRRRCRSGVLVEMVRACGSAAVAVAVPWVPGVLGLWCSCVGWWDMRECGLQSVRPDICGCVRRAAAAAECRERQEAEVRGVGAVGGGGGRGGGARRRACGGRRRGAGGAGA